MLIVHEGVFVAPLLPSDISSPRLAASGSGSGSGSGETKNADFPVYFVPHLVFPSRKNAAEKVDK